MPQEPWETIDEYCERLKKSNQKQKRKRHSLLKQNLCVEEGAKYVMDGQTRCMTHRELHRKYQREYLDSAHQVAVDREKMVAEGLIPGP